MQGRSKHFGLQADPGAGECAKADPDYGKGVADALVKLADGQRVTIAFVGAAGESKNLVARAGVARGIERIRLRTSRDLAT